MGLLSQEDRELVEIAKRIADAGRGLKIKPAPIPRGKLTEAISLLDLALGSDKMKSALKGGKKEVKFAKMLQFLSGSMVFK